MNFKLIPLLLLVSVCSFAQKQSVDLLVYNARIYTVDKNFSVASALAVKNGKIHAVGTTSGLLKSFAATHSIDAGGKFIYPGFIDAHAHFLGYGLSLQRANLMGTKSWEDVVERVKQFAQDKKIPPSAWITGRGWDQNDWDEKEFPTKELLDRAFPDNPVLLTRVDGHGAIANQKAIELAGLEPGQQITGGDIEVKSGKLTGILIDNAIGLVSSKIPAPKNDELAEALADAQKNCFAAGLTSVADCGISHQTATLMNELHQSGELKMRIYGMLSNNKQNYDFAVKNGKIKTPYLSVRSFKVYADGALGSRGAALLQPYSDRPDWQGFLLDAPARFDSIAHFMYRNDFQMCTHAIGDSGNRAMLNIYGKYLKGKNDKRWRIEHAQVINKNDFDLFGRYSIIPSVQPTHATSDMYWAEDRLGHERVKGAYAFKQLLKQNGWIPLGTDFPVEDISPLHTFYSAVFRRDEKNWPRDGYQMENALTRVEALRGMTIWAAKSFFEENEKGSIEKGKYADFIMLDRDLMKVPAEEILKTKVIATYVGGENVYKNY